MEAACRYPLVNPMDRFLAYCSRPVALARIDERTKGRAPSAQSGHGPASRSTERIHPAPMTLELQLQLLLQHDWPKGRFEWLSRRLGQAFVSAARAEALPDLPTVGDFVSGYEASTWNGIGVPAATPAAIIDQLNSTINACLSDPAITTRIAELGSVVLARPLTSANSSRPKRKNGAR